MPRLLSCCLLCLLPAALAAGELDGRYLAILDDLPAEMILHSQGQQIKGQYMENNRLRLTISGHFDGQLLQAQILDPESGAVLANMNANYANAMLNARIVARTLHSHEVLQREALFQRQDNVPSANAQTSDPQRDPALVGTWLHKSHPPAADSAAPARRMTLQLAADGSVAQWQRSGDDAQHADDGPGELQYRGHWRSQDGLLLVQLQGQGDYQPAAYYRIDGQTLVTESNTGKLLWQKR